MNYISDPHPRVRYACCNAIGQMSTDFAPVFEKKFHAKVIPGLLFLMQDSANPRVQAHSGAALVNFSEDCPKNILLPYLPEIMGRLEEVGPSYLYSVLTCTHPLCHVLGSHSKVPRVAPEGEQARVGADRDDHCQRGGHSGGQIY